MEIGKWSDQEVSALFRFVEANKDKGTPLIKIFKSYADLTKRHQNSVRNYYYKEILSLSNDNVRAKKLGIDLSMHVAKNVKPFSDEDTGKLINEINNLLGQGFSVRRACLTLASGDVGLMIRYQNKYRLETKYKKGSGNLNNLIKMPTRQSGITDEEINALMLGLIKLVKKQESEKVKRNLSDELLISHRNQPAKSTFRKRSLISSKTKNTEEILMNKKKNQ